MAIFSALLTMLSVVARLISNQTSSWWFSNLVRTLAKDVTALVGATRWERYATPGPG